jgi:ATP-dependent Lon protease
VAIGSGSVSYAKSRAKELDINEDDFNTTDLHIHIPEGYSKDGPSQVSR